MKRFLFLTVLFFFSFNTLNAVHFDHISQMQAAEEWRQQVTKIDAGIDKLTNLRNLELAKAARAQNQGDRLQFNSNNLIDARRYWQDAENSKAIAARYQEEIDKLENNKRIILQDHGIKYTPPTSKQ